MARPLIGIVPLVDYKLDSLWMLPGYMDGLTAAGAVPVMLPLTSEMDAIGQLVATCDGFLLTGGQDVAPSLYGQGAATELEETCPERDSMEAVLLNEVMRTGKPFLGICRGLQFLNVALGGTLYQDLPTQCPSDVCHRMEAPYDRPAHVVDVVPGTPLALLSGGAQMGVNSCHHQAIRDLAPALAPMAYAPDGIIEAAYAPGCRFGWAVQWHPEFDHLTNPMSRAIFDAFVAACRQTGAVGPLGSLLKPGAMVPFVWFTT